MGGAECVVYTEYKLFVVGRSLNGSKHSLALLPHSEWACGGHGMKNSAAVGVGDVGSIPGKEDHLEKEMTTYPEFLPGKPTDRKSLAVYSPWAFRPSNTT